MEPTDPPAATASLSLNDIRQIPEPQFQQQLLDWMQTTEVSQRLQAKLRADLFNSFNTTTLGRRMASASASGIPAQPGALLPSASPLLLALNTLAAEFLYTQNCQFTLSVLVTETPHPNTMPDFAGAATPFRFSRRQVDQLLTSMMMMRTDGAGVAAAAERLQIWQAYERSVRSGSVNNSLLFMLCQTLMRTSRKPSKIHQLETEEKGTQTRLLQSDQQPNYHHKRSRKSAVHDENHSHSNDEPQKKPHQRPLQTFIARFAAHVERLSETIADFTMTRSENQTDPTFAGRLSKLCHRLQRFARRRPKIAHKMRSLARAVSQLTVSLERCLTDVQAQLAVAPTPTTAAAPVAAPDASASNANQQHLSYTDWVLQMKHSRHGRRFLDQLRAHHREVTQRDAERQRTEWELKFQQERRLMKLHYKQRLLERYRDLLAGGSGNTGEALGVVDGPSREPEVRHVHNKTDVAIMTDRPSATDRGTIAKQRRPSRLEYESVE